MLFIQKAIQICKHLTLFIIVLSSLVGCVASTQLVRNESVEIETKDYRELYFLQPKNDPRHIVPKVIEQFKRLGFNVRVVDSKKPIEGAQGTGFLISDKGYILTCAHVVEEDSEATIWHSGVRYEADILSKDKDIDLALIELREKVKFNISPLSFRYDKGYIMGEDVFTIGYPMSKILGNTARLSKGLISATRGLKDDPNQLQISAEIQPGNSGGPLFDENGVIIGVVQATLNPWKMVQSTGGALPQNVNFAVKSDIVLDFIKTYDEGIYNTLEINQDSKFETIEKAVVKVRSSIISEDLENKPKLVAKLEYHSIWDFWYRFKFFVISVYDFDSQDLLFQAGQGHDNLISTEEVVIEDTFTEIKNELNNLCSSNLSEN